MGYMGFGMRKIDYTRKPKKSFAKIKEIYGNDNPKVKKNPNVPKPSSNDILNKKRFTHVTDTKVYKGFKALLLLAFLAFIVWVAMDLFEVGF